MNKDLFSLNGKVIVITGAGGLLGRQHAEAVTSKGASPILLDINFKSVEKLALELNKRYDVNASGYAVDITREDNVQNNRDVILDNYGKIDVLINNAANNPKVEQDTAMNFTRLENFPVETWDTDISVGLTGAFLCSKHYGFAISNNPSGGVIVNISSDLGLIAPDQRLYQKPGLPLEKQPVKPVSYSVIKTGLIGLTRYLATYWPEKVRCNALCPGGVDTGLPKEFVNQIENLIPMRRMAKSDEYKSAIQFLCSDASNYMNGACLVIDGGRSCL
jgi:NAD(P)-dependent dehydrogenase (short-subunit alcohol dehydrogenase family)